FALPTRWSVGGGGGRSARGGRFGKEEVFVNTAIGPRAPRARPRRQEQPLPEGQELLLAVERQGAVLGLQLELLPEGRCLVDVGLAGEEPLSHDAPTLELAIFDLDTRGGRGLERPAGRRVGVNRVHVPVPQPTVRVPEGGRARRGRRRLEEERRRRDHFRSLTQQIHTARADEAKI